MKTEDPTCCTEDPVQPNKQTFKNKETSCYFQFSSAAQSCQTLCDPMACSTPGLSVHHSRSLPKLLSTESVMPSNHLILCCPLLLPPSSSPSIRVFANESALRITCPKYWSFSFNISPSNEHPGLISFRMDWLDLLAVKSLLQYHNSKASILWHSAFFTVQLSHPYMRNSTTYIRKGCCKGIQRRKGFVQSHQ